MLKKILENIASGGDIVSLFLKADQPPSMIYWSLKDFLGDPDLFLAQEVAEKHKVNSQYLLDRVSDVIERIDRFRETNPYAVLNLTYQADAASIQDSWKRMLKKWHPDRHGNRNESLTMTQKINDAYMILKSLDTRRAYDKQYAPFLMIVKDIEARERPPRLGRKRIPILKWRYLVLAILIVLAGLFVWKVR